MKHLISPWKERSVLSGSDTHLHHPSRENIRVQPVFAPTGNQTHTESEWFFRNLLAANKAANPLLLSSHSLSTAGKHQDDAFHLARPKAVTLLHLWPCEETVRFVSAPTPSFIIEQDPKTMLAAQLVVSRTTFLLLLKLTLTHLTVSVAARESCEQEAVLQQSEKV